MIAIVLAAVVSSTDFLTTPEPYAEGCTGTNITCNSHAMGRLTATDCTANGAPFDAYYFDGSAGDEVDITIRSSNFEQPLITLFPPSGDASKTPLIYGGKNGASLFYILGSSGRWQISAGSKDIFASGDYLLSLSCARDTDPTLPQNCIAQSLLCGQTAASHLTGQNCRYSGSPDFTYEEFDIFGVAGDSVSVSMEAFGFAPAVGMYDLDTGRLLASSRPGPNGTQVIDFTFPQTKQYAILATSQDARAIGSYNLTVQCAISGCLEPILTSQPASKNVQTGQRATLTADANGTNVTINWYDVRDVPGVLVGTGAAFTTPPVTSPQFYQATAANECGAVQSVIVNVTPEAARRRSVKH
jgi:hypothetical protein